MTALNADFRCKNGQLPAGITLKFGKRTGPGGGTDQARFAEQVKVVADPIFGYVMRAEMKPGDTAQWADYKSSTPCVALVGANSPSFKVGDEGWFHMVFDASQPGMSSDLAWELHGSGAGDVNSDLAPYALHVHAPHEEFRNGQFVTAKDQSTPGLCFRIATGLIPGSGGSAPFKHTDVLIPGFQPVPKGFAHGLLHIVFAHSGSLDLYAWKHGDPVPTVPVIALKDVPTITWRGSIEDGLWAQWGNYGYPSGIEEILHAGWTVRPTREVALADFPLGGVTPTPTPTPPPTPGTKLNVRKVNGADPNLVYIQWDPVTGAKGYVFWADGKQVSRTNDPVGPGGKPQTRFSKPVRVVGVQALVVGASENLPI